MPATYFCIPDLSGVPGSSGQFDWWTVSPPDPTGVTPVPTPSDPGPNPIRHYPDNPDWLGAFSLSEGDGANRDMQFRALKGAIAGQQYLFLSWVIRISDLNAAIDRVNIVLGDGTNYVAIQPRLNSSSSQVAGTQDAGFYTYRIHNCTVSGSAISQVNPALSIDGAAIETTGRMWVDVTSPGRLLQTKWAFQVAIPLGVAWAPSALTLPVSGPFKLWYEVVASLPGSTLVRYLVPPPASPLVPVNTTSVLQVVPTGLQSGHMLDMSTGTADCVAGVTISYSGIGVRNVDGTARTNPYAIQLDLGQPYPPNLAATTNGASLYPESHTPNVSLPQYQNQFYAQPDVSGLTVTQQAAVRARFSLANWGSQLSVATASSWRPVPGGDAVAYQPALGEARFIWPLPGPGGTADSFTTTLVRNINKYLNHVWNNTLASVPAAQSPHQCMLVELSSTDSSVAITRSSLYVNMNITSASVAREPARISIEDLAPIGTRPRDVYLYLQTFNMPKVVKDGNQKGILRTFDARRGMTAVRGPQASAGDGEGPGGYEVEDIAAWYPTYIVHVYHDTGEEMTLEDGSRVPVLRSQTAFGYFVLHEGGLVGWETRLYGAEKITDNFYRLRVPNNSAAYVETAIQARESETEAPLPPDGIPGGTSRCRRLVAWLKTKGIIGKILAMIVALICRLLGQ